MKTNIDDLTLDEIEIIEFLKGQNRMNKDDILATIERNNWNEYHNFRSWQKDIL